MIFFSTISFVQSFAIIPSDIQTNTRKKVDD